MLNTQYSTIMFILLLALLSFSTVSCVASDDVGLLPFSRLASDSVKKQVGKYYQPPKLENALISALQKKRISAKLANYPAGQQPFTYDEIEAPQFDIDADDFATPEQILSDIASNQGFKQIIFGHIEEVSDDLYLVTRVYSASDIRSAEEQTIHLKNLTPKAVKNVLPQLALEIKKILQKPQSQLIFPRNPLDELDTNNVGLLGLDDHSKVGYSVEDIYRMILEYEFYVHPAQKHQSTIDNLVNKFSTTKKELDNELKYHSRSAKRRYYGTSYGPLLYMVTSKPTRKRKKHFIAPSSEVFDLCIFDPYKRNLGFQWLTRDEAKRVLEKIRKVPIWTDQRQWMPLNDWRIPTIQELFAITSYLPLIKRAGKKGYSFWSDTLTATGDAWTIRKFPTRFDQQGNLSKYGIDFDSASPSNGDKALLVAVRTCPQ